MRVNPLAQRDLRPARVSRLAAVFDLEQMGAPTVSHRGDWYYLIDGQHRIAALKQWLGTWQDQQVQCWTYEGLTEAQEAEVFLKLNDVLPSPRSPSSRSRCRPGGRGEADVDRIVRALGLRIAPAGPAARSPRSPRCAGSMPAAAPPCCPRRCGSSGTPTARPAWTAR